jgi:dTDP-4-amino-4,6-dideoxygalactose transaminase
MINPNLFGASVIGHEEEAEVAAAIRSGDLSRFGRDPSVVDRVEQKIAAATSFRFCILTTNGTCAIRAALAAIGVVAGDLVAVSAFTFVATANVT